MSKGVGKMATKKALPVNRSNTSICHQGHIP
jgi:hypothetical protein